MKIGFACTERKVACDRGQPSCDRCLKTDRNCLGYAIRLVWPDTPDGRRKLPSAPLPVDTERPCTDGAFYGQQFLNTSYEDIERSRGVFTSLVLYDRLHGRPQPCLTLVPDLQGQEPHLLAYCKQRSRLIVTWTSLTSCQDEQKITRMISTVDANNGFRNQIMPMAISGCSLAAKALRSAVLSLAAFHRHGRNAALPHKTHALQFLSHSLERDSVSYGHIEVQLAASMMMCVYNVRGHPHSSLWTELSHNRSSTKLRVTGTSTSKAHGPCCTIVRGKKAGNWNTAS